MWDFFDKAYCICLESRKDRQIQAKVQFDKVGLSDKVEFVIVKKHPVNSEQGIYESHLHCIRKGIAADAKNILIFEDDVDFERFDKDRLLESIDFLSNNQWNAMFFGCLVKGCQKTAYKSVLKIRYRCLAHAYVLNRSFAETIAKTRWNRIPYDDYLASFQDGFFMCYPSFAFQSNSPTDNTQLAKLDKVRRILGGLKQIQKRNEFFHYHKPMIIILHLAVILIIGMLLGVTC